MADDDTLQELARDSESNEEPALGDEARCEHCQKCSYFGRLESYERKGNLDIRDHLKIYMGADDERPLKETAEEYVALHYPQAYTKAYSLPEGYILRKRKFTELRLEVLKKEKDVTMPPDQLSVAIVFDRVKGAFQGLPSLTVQDYAFDDTLLKGINEKLKNKFFLEFGVTKDDIKSGDHDVFGTAISGSNILGLFFQIKGVTSKTSQRGILNSIRKATEQVEKDFNIFRTLCSEFLNPTVKLAGFVALPMLSKMELQKLIECSDCRMRILVSEDVDHPESFRTFLARHNIILEKPFDSNSECPVMKTFKDIFDLYVSAASALDLPRNPHQLYNTSEEQMKEMTVLLTPQQRKLAKSESRVIFLAGGSGTGKTFVLKRRALKLQERGEVLLINVAGGLLTEEFRYAFEGKDGITVIDGREKEFEKDPEKFKNFLVEMGKGKHVLVDEVPITLGFQGLLTSDALSAHWTWMVELQEHFKSITLAFRPNDQSYYRDFPLQDVKPGTIQIDVLDRVKRNSRKISELFQAIGDYFRRIFISHEKTLPMDMKEPGGECLPSLFTIPSCSVLHPNGCEDKMFCWTMKACHVVQILYARCTRVQHIPLFVVVDDDVKKASLVNMLSSQDDTVLPLFLGELPQLKSQEQNRGSNEKESEEKKSANGNGKQVEFRCFSSTTISLPNLLIVTEHEMIGCHFDNVTVVLDFPPSKWINYLRMIESNGNNMIIVIEEEDLATGKFSRVVKDIPDWNIMRDSTTIEDLTKKLEMWKKNEETIALPEHKAVPFTPSYPRPQPFELWLKEDEDAKKLLSSSLNGIFGYPASGKSRRVHRVVMQAMALQEKVLFLHGGGRLSRELCRWHWRTETQLTLIDNITDHKELWTKMIEEERVQPLSFTIGEWPDDMEMQLQTLIEFDKGLHSLQESGGECQMCDQFSFYGELKCYEKRGNFEFPENVKICMRSTDGRDMKEAMDTYVRQYCSEPYSRAHSSPEGYILGGKKLEKFMEMAKKGRENIELFQLPDAMVFHRLKDAFNNVPSLTGTHYAFKENFSQGASPKQNKQIQIKQKKREKEKQILDGEFDVLRRRYHHDVFVVGISGNQVFGLFFRVNELSETDLHEVVERHEISMRRIKRDVNVFRNTFGEYLNSSIKLAGFAAFPLLSKISLREYIKCRKCEGKILTSEDLDSSDSFSRFLKKQGIVLEKSRDRDPESPVMKTYKYIFDFYICVASCVDHPRNPTELFTQCKELMTMMQVHLPKKQKEIVTSKENTIFIFGGSGTGKTTIIKERALELAKGGDVLVINMSGGFQTNKLRRLCKGQNAAKTS
ncbi:unnamed protein product [Darwinula stevensoni]|uniref:Uncharacterized protein n=1 Tax=Darwinula stevensoni TaxID=69355 RepID=A0A7R9A262_9CRUS|nr:unnamed protein product [Darwinula stevensoni]CAG0889083.1 unnamed protein product [Darwinula stevensoni]